MNKKAIDLSLVRTYSILKRKSKVNLAQMYDIDGALPVYENSELKEVADQIVSAHCSGRPVIVMTGAHLVKQGLSPLLIDLMEKGVITHLASNGAATIHDFEIAFQGQTSEDVSSSLEDGSFGMAEETGAYINKAISSGARQGLGIGESMGKMLAEGDSRYPYRKYSLLYNAYRLGISYTVHIAIGTDIIHQHPLADFASLGWGSGQDFKIFCSAISELEGGVFCNFGSAVIGPEIFLKALSIVRNLNHNVRVFTTANFDLVPLGDYRKPVKETLPEYYYRPRKNIVTRPVSLGGKGYHITGNHLVTLPNLHHGILTGIQRNTRPPKSVVDESAFVRLCHESPGATKCLIKALECNPKLEICRESLVAAFLTIRQCFLTGGTLFLAGNGGSMADALHISGELLKSFQAPRPIPPSLAERLAGLENGKAVAQSLQGGLRAMVLGTNTSISSAVRNDFSEPNMELTQELYALARPADVFLGISTSGNASNIISAATLATALAIPVIILTGKEGGRLSKVGDVVIRTPFTITSEIQQFHVLVYHLLCDMLETEFFKGK